MILTTGGGYIEVVKRIVETLRHHYAIVDFVIPNYAYSAGTVLALSGDSIYMDYYSRLGPIDPQVQRPDGKGFVPALGYLARYNSLIKKAHAGEITVAEVQLLVDGFDQAELYQYQQAHDLSVSLLVEWLATYKFKDWNETSTRKMAVTKEMKEDRAKEIAIKLNDTERWHSHGYGISRDVLQKDLGLIIDDFGTKPSMNNAIRSYHRLIDDYMAKMGSRSVIHTFGDYTPFA